jgi:hypothetical protein
VALTRHRAQTRLFVARNTAKNLAELARQIARPDEKRAASQFFPVGPDETAAPLTAAALNAQFAAGGASRRHNGTPSRPSNDNVPPRAASNDNDRQAFHQATPSAASGAAPSPSNTRHRSGGDLPIGDHDRHRRRSRTVRQGRGSPALAGFSASSSNR